MIQQLDMFIEPQSYYQSPRWQQLRTERLILDNHRCRMCDAPAQAVHHRRYPKVMGDEVVEDLTPLKRIASKRRLYTRLEGCDAVQRRLDGLTAA